MQVTHTQSVVLAALTFAGDLKRCKGMPLQRSAKSAPAAGTAASQLGPPQTLAEQVLQSFAQNNIPVHQPLVLPLLIPCLDCPGASHANLACGPECMCTCTEKRCYPFLQSVGGQPSSMADPLMSTQ